MNAKIRLSIVGADEDVPRLLTGYSPRVCGGEAAFVLRPREGQGLLVLQEKKQPAKVWISDRSLLPTSVEVDRRARAVSDAPGTPSWSVSPTEAVALVKRMKANAGTKGPASLRGTCDEDASPTTAPKPASSYAKAPSGRSPKAHTALEVDPAKSALPVNAFDDASSPAKPDGTRVLKSINVCSS